MALCTVPQLVVFLVHLFLSPLTESIEPWKLLNTQQHRIGTIGEKDLNLFQEKVFLCKAKFKHSDLPEWNKNIASCAKETGYNNKQFVKFIDVENYSQLFDHDDKCFHYCVLKKMGHLNAIPDQLAGGINFTKYNYQFIVAFEEMRRQYSIVDFATYCDSQTVLAIEQVYGLSNDPIQIPNLKSKDTAPWNNPECLYINLFSFCFRNFAGNINFNIADLEEYYENCIMKVAFKALLENDCNKLFDYNPLCAPE